MPMALRTVIEDRVQAMAKRKHDRALSELERRRTGIVFEPLAHRDEPYSHYAMLRERDPVHHHPRVDGLVLTRHADCLDAIRDPRFSSDSRHLRLYENLKAQSLRDGGNPAAFDNPPMLNLDAPEHTRLRSLVSKAFTPRAVSALIPRVEAIAAELLGGTRPGTVFDWMKTVAHPMPSIVIAEMLGVPAEDRARFHAWTVDIMAGGVLEVRARRRRASQAMAELVAYFVEIIKLRRAEPGPDILSALVRVEAEDGDRLNFAELIGTCTLLLLAGHAGTSSMLGNGLLSLMRNPEQAALLREDPALWPTAIEEMLRFEGAVQAMFRIAKEDLRIHGKPLKKGQTAMLVLAAANRDPEVFDDPDRFDITRQPNDHLAFGRGRHFCLGASLARLEMKIALRTLFERFPGLVLAEKDPRWTPIEMRMLAGLPLRGVASRPRVASRLAFTAGSA